MPGAHALTRSRAVRRSRPVHACGTLRLVGGCTWRHSNVGGVTAGQVHWDNSSGKVMIVRALMSERWDRTGG